MKKTVKTLVLALSVLVLSASVAMAELTIDAAKMRGLVGEKPNGLIGIVVDSPSSEVQILAQSTNDARIVLYQSIASKNGTSVNDVMVVAGKKLVDGTAPGQYFMTAEGVWQKK